MKKILRIITVFAFLVLVFGINAAFGLPKSIKLEYNPKVGSSTKFLMLMTAFTTLEGNFGNEGQPPLMESVAKVKSTFTQNINSIDSEGNIDMEITYNDVSLEIEQGSEKISVPLGDKIGGKTIDLKISKKGKILEIKKLKDLPVEFREFDLQKLYPQVNPYFPSGKLEVGDTWNQEIDETTPIGEGMLLKQKMKIDYTLNSFAQIKDYQCAVIGVKIKIEIIGESEKGSDVLGIKCIGEGTGTMNYAYEVSKPVSSKMTIDLNTRMALGSDKEQESKIRQKIEISMDVIK